MNRVFSGKISPDTCAHTETVVVNTIGLRRAICEACNHVSVNFIDDIDGDVDRDAFAREADEFSKAETSENTPAKHMAVASV